jgi:hypothetical protein
MNDVYFACRDCCEMIDAGYRWAYAWLEHPGIVTRSSPVRADVVLACAEYWAPPTDSVERDFTGDAVTLVGPFLERHRSHALVYGDYFEIIGSEPAGTLRWLDHSSSAKITLPYIREILGLRRWPEVLAWVKNNRRPWWWSIDEIKDAVRVELEKLARQEE